MWLSEKNFKDYRQFYLRNTKEKMSIARLHINWVYKYRNCELKSLKLHGINHLRF